MIPSFPKIFAIGSRQTERLFSGEVEITEKIDGSHIAFGVMGGYLFMRSKGAQLYVDNPDKMFVKAIEIIKDRFDRGLLLEGWLYYGEYLKSERHNTIRYGRVPNNHIALFAVYNDFNKDFHNYNEIVRASQKLDLDVAPLIFQGKVNSIEELKDNINRISHFGKEKVEGFVVKNYNEQLLIGGQVIPILMGKYVSEDFKEIHKREWKSENTPKGKWDVYKSQFKSNARWIKAVHFLRDNGKLTDSPQDIGGLIKHIHNDILEEESENIKQWLFNEYKGELLRDSVKGFPEWYKNYLLEKALPESSNE